MFYSVWITGDNLTEYEKRGIQVSVSGISKAKESATKYAGHEDSCKGRWVSELTGVLYPKHSGLYTRTLESGKLLNLCKE